MRFFNQKARAMDIAVARDAIGELVAFIDLKQPLITPCALVRGVDARRFVRVAERLATMARGFEQDFIAALRLYEGIDGRASPLGDDFRHSWVEWLNAERARRGVGR